LNTVRTSVPSRHSWRKTWWCTHWHLASRWLPHIRWWAKARWLPYIRRWAKARWSPHIRRWAKARWLPHIWWWAKARWLPHIWWKIKIRWARQSKVFPKIIIWIYIQYILPLLHNSIYVKGRKPVEPLPTRQKPLKFPYAKYDCITRQSSSFSSKDLMFFPGIGLVEGIL